jgi:trans-aconitate methyltransferase
VDDPGTPVKAPHLRAIAVALALACTPRDAPAGGAREPDVRYEPTSPEVVEAMLRLARVGPQDVVYDLGCGDGRIVVAAAQRFGARGVGIDIDPRRVAEAKENVRRAGVEGRVEIRQGDLFEADVRDATAVMLYLWPHVNLKLRPKLLAELRPGTRVVSHSHDMGDWKPDEQLVVRGARLFLWRIPERGAP